MTAVCITGMHRSGTSLVAQTLRECGVFLGPEEDLLPAAPENRDGFWEHAALTALNDEILSALGGSWRDPPDLSGNWERRPELGPLAARAEALIAPLREHPPWGWKDPRSSLTLPFWRHVIGEGLRVVLCVRDPLEVVDSLVERNGMTREQAAKLWLTYTRTFLSATSKPDRLVVLYDAFLADPPAELARLVDFLELSPAPLQWARALESVNRGLRHHVATAERPNALPGAVRETYESLRAEGENTRTTRRAAPDAAIQLEAVRALLEEARSRVYALQDEVAANEAHVAELHDRAREAAAGHRRQVEALKAELRKCAAHVDELAAHVDELAEELRALKATRLWRIGTRWWTLKARLRGGGREVG